MGATPARPLIAGQGLYRYWPSPPRFVRWDMRSYYAWSHIYRIRSLMILLQHAAANTTTRTSLKMRGHAPPKYQDYLVSERPPQSAEYVLGLIRAVGASVTTSSKNATRLRMLSGKARVTGAAILLFGDERGNKIGLEFLDSYSKGRTK